jgi:hypothetical protein
MRRSVNVFLFETILWFYSTIRLFHIAVLSVDNSGPFTRAVLKISSHFEYLENRSSGFHVTWQPVRGDLILCIRERSLSLGASKSAVRRH